MLRTEIIKKVQEELLATNWVFVFIEVPATARCYYKMQPHLRFSVSIRRAGTGLDFLSHECVNMKQKICYIPWANINYWKATNYSKLHPRSTLDNISTRTRSSRPWVRQRGRLQQLFFPHPKPREVRKILIDSRKHPRWCDFYVSVSLHSCGPKDPKFVPVFDTFQQCMGLSQKRPEQ